MFLVLLFFTIISLALAHQWRARKQLPRGPYPLPLIGNLHQLLYYCWKNGGLVEGYAEIQKSFGKVYTLWIGPLPTVFIADFEVAHETHVKRAHEFGTRYAPGLMNYNRYERGVVASNGEFFQEHSRFVLSTFRNFASGRNIMEERIMDEYRYRFEDFASSNGICNKERKIFETWARPFFDLLTGSVINKILINERFEQNDPEFEKLVSRLAKGFENTGFLDIFCPVRILESRFLKWRQDTIFEPFNYILELNKKSIARRVAQLKADEHVLSDDPDDFLDAYLLKMQKDKNEGLETTFTLENLAVDMYDLWLGGQETTSTTLNWACACLLNRPDVITTAREELIRVTGGHRSLSLIDRRETPYLSAVISEVQRFASILNMNLFRIIKEDTVVDGQPLRAGTAVTAHIAMIHVDEDLFKNHTEFRPERFLENDDLDKKLIPFGIGRRSCLGESLAKAELYLVLGNLLLDYDLEPVGEIPKLKTLAPFGLLKQSPEFRIRFVEVEKH
ncbi:CYtochrome P450 family [Caenorhabditis elegans]|uniref:CYtochrome P450 family n=1 Tax=Caenorhabditis elegans TaxID=6239 RepID=O62378_CAEEL|nr:CYtochrome P450 family [Caenorhabditis elegans]CAB03340.1 CYtochrome P450 family [Caenorhabditis elegans]|eukprot:NP_506787.1 CYtochrome P450 family [Caenorhabditis elegans]